MEKTIKGRLVQKHDIEAHWNLATNFIPKQGELIIYDIDDNYDYERIKIGDGVSYVTDLPFILDNLKDVKIPHLNADNITVSGTLKVKGETIFDKIVNRVVDGAVIVLNGSTVSSPTTMLGQVILTGTAALNGTCNFKDILSNYSEVYYDISGPGMYFNETPIDSLLFVTEMPDDINVVHHLVYFADEGGEYPTEYVVYNSSAGGWLVENFSVTFDNYELPTEYIPWFTENVKNIDECLKPNYYSAYAILYDPQEEAIRLGKGEYLYEENNSQFAFFEGEGAPIAVRNLAKEDDGRFIIWNSEAYSFIKSPMTIGTGTGSATIGNDAIGNGQYGK